ncbi:MAG: hypothetical protein MJ130_11435 [Lachnospiraceae bacterium]|nr:hypothetical protein [Lachnospiraceae bacterium]
MSEFKNKYITFDGYTFMNCGALVSALMELGNRVDGMSVYTDYLVTNPAGSTNDEYIDQLNAHRKNPIIKISSGDLINLLLEDEHSKEVYEKYQKAYEGFDVSLMCNYGILEVQSYIGMTAVATIPEGVHSTALGWCQTEIEALTIPASFFKIDVSILDSVKSAKLIVIKGAHEISKSMFNELNCALIFENMSLKDLPSSAKKKAAIGFTIDYFTNRNIDSAYRDDYRSYIKRQLLSLKPEMKNHVSLLKYFIEEQLISDAEALQMLNQAITEKLYTPREIKEVFDVAIKDDKVESNSALLELRNKWKDEVGEAFSDLKL